MTRTFIHSFDPASESPVAGPTVDHEVSDIEDAGVREVLQTPGAAYGAWSILDALPAATGPGTPFIFKEPLGQRRHHRRGRLVGRERPARSAPSSRPVPRVPSIAPEGPVRG